MTDPAELVAGAYEAAAEVARTYAEKIPYASDVLSVVQMYAIQQAIRAIDIDALAEGEKE